MGLFDQIVGGLMGNSGASSALQGLLTNMLSGNQQGQANQGQDLPAGGIGGLLASLEQAGLGQAVQSWIGSGTNQPISPDQLHSALGEEQVQSMASQSGMSTRDLLLQLSQHLPAIIDSLTPHGQLPPQVAEQKSSST